MEWPLYALPSVFRTTLKPLVSSSKRQYAHREVLLFAIQTSEKISEAKVQADADRRWGSQLDRLGCAEHAT
jgi:hypothetical protein